MSDVNLLPTKILKEQEASQKHYLINVVSIVGLVILTFLVSGLFLYQTILNQELSQEQDKIAQASKKIEGYKELEGTLLSLQQKFSVYQDIKEKGLDRAKIWSQLATYLTPATSFKKLDIDEQGKMTLSLLTDSYTEAAAFLEKMKADGFSQIEIKSVAKDLQSGKILVSSNFQKANKEAGN